MATSLLQTQISYERGGMRLPCSGLLNVQMLS